MKYQAATIALTAALAVPTATANPIKTKVGATGGSFTLHQVHNPSFRPHGAMQLSRVYAKYGVPMPEGLARTVEQYRASRTQNQKRSNHGSVTTRPEFMDSKYLTPVHIGTPPQVMNVDLDSGSSDFWVFSTDTPQKLVYGQALYQPDASLTSTKVEGASWNMSYGDGSHSYGVVYRDVVNIGGVEFESQGIESAQSVSLEFSLDPNFDGILGMGFGAQNNVKPKREKTFFENVADGLDIAAWTADMKYHTPGSYDFGVIDHNKYLGNLSYVDVDSRRGYWNFTATIDGEDVPGIADTGTTLLVLPQKITQKYWDQVDGSKYDKSSGLYSFPCNATLPDFTFSPGSVDITIPGAELNFQEADETSVHCIGGLQSNENFGVSIYGDVALKAAFVVFDMSKDTPRLGWARKAQEVPNSSSRVGDGGDDTGSD